jgi:two-component system, NarL family, response regulator NreC
MTRILVVDDKAYVRNWIREFLAIQPDWQVCGEAENGLQAVEQAAGLQPHVILLDIYMPEMNGFDAAQLILKASPHILILMVSLHKDRQFSEAAKECGAKGLVLKSDAATTLLPPISTVSRGELHFPVVPSN